MIERKLSTDEVKQIYKEINDAKLEPFDIEYDRKSSDFYYELNGKQYRLIYDGTGDWFCDIIYEGKYKDLVMVVTENIPVQQC